MIEPGYVQTMARYNAWQNGQLIDMLDGMTQADAEQDRGAFFGSILGTLNHLLWGDQIWMSRFDPRLTAPETPGPDSPKLTPTLAVWGAERFAMDGKITAWAERLRAIDLKGDLTWTSGMTGKTVTLPLAVCITHMFNHQTHHRGQVHAMMTAMDLKAPVSDLAFMDLGT